MRALLLTLHLLGACVWTGGHLVLAITVLPRALSRRDVRVLQGFEEPFERIGIPALIVQVLTGVWLAAQFAPVSRWLAFGTPLEQITRAKRARLRRLASRWLVAHGVLFDEVRIDVVGLIRRPSGDYEIEHARGVG